MIFRSKHLLRLNEVKDVSFECILYWIKVATRHGTTRHGPTGIRSRFCEANTFFVSAPNELKLYVLVDQALNYTFFFQVEKLRENLIHLLLHAFPKTFWVEISENCLESCILDTSLHAISSSTLHISINIKHVYLQ